MTNRYYDSDVDDISNHMLMTLEMFIRGDLISNHPAGGHSQKSHGRKGRGRSGGGGGGGGAQAIDEKQQRANQKQWLKKKFGLQKEDFGSDHSLNKSGLEKVQKKVPELNHVDIEMMRGMDLFDQKQYVRQKATGGKAKVLTKKSGKVVPPSKKTTTKETTKETTKKTTTAGQIDPPHTITHTGEKTEFGQSVWNEMGSKGTTDVDKVKKVGSMVREKMEKDNPQFKKKMKALDTKVSEKNKIDTKLNTMKKKQGIKSYEQQRKEQGKKYDPNSPEAAASMAFTMQNNKDITRSVNLEIEIHELAKDAGNDIMNAVPKTIGQVRSMGTKVKVQGQFKGSKGAQTKIRNAAEDAKQKLPRDWMREASADKLTYKGATRGQYEGHKKQIQISGNTRQERESVMIHELTHHRQYKTRGQTEGSKVSTWDGGMIKVEDAFLASRTKGEKLTTIYTNKKGEKEIGYEDKFSRHYMGRVYNETKASPTSPSVGYGAKEIATMGVQGVLSNKFNMAADKDYLDLSLGILATQ